MTSIIKRTKHMEMHWQNSQRDTMRFERRFNNQETGNALIDGSIDKI